MSNSQNIAVVFGLFETGLGVIRGLGRKGIKVIGIDYKKDIGWYSRYVNPLKCPHPIKEKQKFINWIIKEFEKFDRPVPVFITGDDFLKVISEERETLKQIFKFNLPSDKLLKAISDKYTQAELSKTAGIPGPETWLLETDDDLYKLKKNDRWPLIVKGRDVNSWRTFYGGSVKGFLVSDFNDLQNQLNKAVSSGVKAILQEVIEGPDTNHYKYCAYISKEGVTLAEFCLRKIRQNPIHFGVGAVVESIYDDQLIKTGRLLFKGLNYKGVGSAEFKRDEKDGKLKLIELNTRYWQQNSLAEACGINFPWLNYLDLEDKKPDVIGNYITGLKWVNRYLDFDSFLKYRKEGILSYCTWRESLKGKKVYSDFSWDDPLPIFFELRFGLKILKIPGYLIKRIF